MKFKNEDGFSLLELVVSAAVMGVIIVAIYGFFGSVREINRYANNLVIANQALQQQVEIYRNTPYAGIAVGTQNLNSALTAYPSLKNGTMSAVVTEPQVTGYKQIAFTLSYLDKGGTKTVKASTIIANRGINR
jgi:prepilin-type N-terminal cleavage/methylation domain-containing protein